MNWALLNAHPSPSRTGHSVSISLVARSKKCAHTHTHNKTNTPQARGMTTPSAVADQRALPVSPPRARACFPAPPQQSCPHRAEGWPPHGEAPGHSRVLQRDNQPRRVACLPLGSKTFLQEARLCMGDQRLDKTAPSQLDKESLIFNNVNLITSYLPKSITGLLAPCTAVGGFYHSHFSDE